MSDAANECIPYYEPGTRITGHCEKAVTGKRFVDISDDIQSGPGLSATAEGGNIVIELATAKALGVASHDAGEGEKVTIIRGPTVVPVTAKEAISAGEEVGVGEKGQAVKAVASSGKEIEEGKPDFKVAPVGRCLADVAEGKDAMVALYV